MYLFSLLFAVISGSMYHISQKNIPKNLNPALSLMITFTVALIGSVIWYVFTKDNREVSGINTIPWPSIILGLCVIGLEFSILMAYRSGWKISQFNLVYSLILIMVLVPVGMLVFKEVLSLKTVIGMMLSILGIVLVKIG